MRRSRPLVEELDFNDDHRPPPRTGDPVDAADVGALLTSRRGRQAGLTGAAVNDDDVTADDLSPQTLIDEDGADAPGRRRRGAADTVLRRVDEAEVFAPPNELPEEPRDR